MRICIQRVCFKRSANNSTLCRLVNKTIKPHQMELDDKLTYL
ncbi:hypothetical protein PALB_25780 [Pseudoalteromonas luteoviolacea B = ATCC 29581]|nr:hypothetical protein PALB_25780 [Pseudoalteromonas luteoviolacea B = ATCC 29581]